MNVFFGNADLCYACALAGKISHGFLHQRFGYRRARGDADACYSLKPFAINFFDGIHKVRLRSSRTRHAAKLVRVLAVVRADYKDQLRFVGQLFDRILTVLRGIADVVLRRADHLRKFLPQDIEDLTRVIDAQGRLRENGYLVRVRNVNLLGFGAAADNPDAVGRFAARADDFIVIFMTDENDPISFGCKAAHFAMNLFHQRAGGVDDDLYPPLTRFQEDSGRHAVGAQYEFSPRRNLGNRGDKNHSSLTKSMDDVLVVYDFMKNVDRRAEFFEGALDNGNRHLHAGAETSRAGQNNLLDCHRF